MRRKRDNEENAADADADEEKDNDSEADDGEEEADDNKDKDVRQGRRKKKKTLREQMGPDEWLRFKDFKKKMNKFICTTRFTDETWAENQNYMRNHVSSNKTKCIYGSPFTLKSRIPHEGIAFVLEMNNDQNRIMGVGLIRNHPIQGKHRIYENGNYNRYAYLGLCHISREEMTEDENNIMNAFDILCFKGSKHMKRGSGINLFPDEILFKCLDTVHLVEFVSGMFKRRMITKKESAPNNVSR